MPLKPKNGACNVDRRARRAGRRALRLRSPVIRRVYNHYFSSCARACVFSSSSCSCTLQSVKFDSHAPHIHTPSCYPKSELKRIEHRRSSPYTTDNRQQVRPRTDSRRARALWRSSPRPKPSGRRDWCTPNPLTPSQAPSVVIASGTGGRNVMSPARHTSALSLRVRPPSQRGRVASP